MEVGVEIMTFGLNIDVQTFREEESEAIEEGNMTGKFIVIEGLDATGKSTLVESIGQTFNSICILFLGCPFQSFDYFLWIYDGARAAQLNGLYVFPLNVLPYRRQTLYHKHDERRVPTFDTQ